MEGQAVEEAPVEVKPRSQHSQAPVEVKPRSKSSPRHEHRTHPQQPAGSKTTNCHTAPWVPCMHGYQACMLSSALPPLPSGLLLSAVDSTYLVQADRFEAGVVLGKHLKDVHWPQHRIASTTQQHGHCIVTAQPQHSHSTVTAIAHSVTCHWAQNREHPISTTAVR